jgi:hypothetical protein
MYGVRWHVIWCVACSSMTWSILLSHLWVLSLSKKSSLIWASRWWAPWLSVRVFSHFRAVSRLSRDCVTCHRHHMTYPDLCWSVVMISAHSRWFAMIFTFGQRLALIANPDLVPHSTVEVLQFGKTIAEDTGILGYQKREAASAYCFGPTSVRRFRDIVTATQARNRC